MNADTAIDAIAAILTTPERDVYVSLTRTTNRDGQDRRHAGGRLWTCEVRMMVEGEGVRFGQHAVRDPKKAIARIIDRLTSTVAPVIDPKAPGAAVMSEQRAALLELAKSLPKAAAQVP